MSNNHLQKSELDSYIKLELDEIENERIFRHLSECEKCLEEVELLLKIHEENSGEIDSERMKRHLLQKIYRTNLIGQFIKLSGMGFLTTILGLLYPLQRNKRVSSQREEQ